MLSLRSLIVAYMPTDNNDDTTKDTFHVIDRLASTIHSTPAGSLPAFGKGSHRAELNQTLRHVWK